MGRIRSILITSAVTGIAMVGLAAPASAGAPGPNNPVYYGTD